jgi:hypothetical protein
MSFVYQIRPTVNLVTGSGNCGVSSASGRGRDEQRHPHLPHLRVHPDLRQ